jgi:hypothetical protein
MYIERNTKYIKSTLTLTVRVLTVKGNRFDLHLCYACELTCTIRISCIQTALRTVAYTGTFFGGGGGIQQIQLRTEDRENSGRGSPLVRDSGGSCNLVKEISFHIVKFS